MTEAIEEPPVKKGLSGTALRIATVLPLIPIILWMMFAGPLWVWQTFILAAVAVGGYELMAMKVPSSRGLRHLGFRIFGSVRVRDHLPSTPRARCTASC